MTDCGPGSSENHPAATIRRLRMLSYTFFGSALYHGRDRQLRDLSAKLVAPKIRNLHSGEQPAVDFSRFPLGHFNVDKETVRTPWEHEEALEHHKSLERLDGQKFDEERLFW